MRAGMRKRMLRTYTRRVCVLSSMITACAFPHLRASLRIVSFDQEEYLVLSEDGSRVFVPKVTDFLADETITLAGGQSGSFGELFPVSGMYDTESMEPLWQIPEEQPLRYYELSPDFTLLAWLNRDLYLVGGPELLVMKLYREGELLFSLKQEDLQLQPFRRSSGFFDISYTDLEWLREARFEDGALYVTVSGKSWFSPWGQVELGGGSVFQVDVDSGDVQLVEQLPLRFWVSMGIPLFLLVLLITIGCWILFRLRLSRT